MTKTLEVSLCADCVAVEANGYDPEAIGPDWPGFRSEFVGALFGPRCEEPDDCDGDHPPHFSWNPCDGCGTGLGGDRYDYLAVLR